MLEGGIDAWRVAGGETPAPATTKLESRPVTITPRPRAYADLELMREAVFEGRALIDVQDDIAAPSIPGAWRTPLSRLVGEAGIVDRAAVADAVRLSGFGSGRKRVVFGTDSRDGAAAWFLFGPVSGLEDVRLFAGGMNAWRAYPDLPRTDNVPESGF